MSAVQDKLSEIKALMRRLSHAITRGEKLGPAGKKRLMGRALDLSAQIASKIKELDSLLDKAFSEPLDR
jgi:hypothetical protein